jgi:hypothetical protein
VGGVPLLVVTASAVKVYTPHAFPISNKYKKELIMRSGRLPSVRLSVLFLLVLQASIATSAPNFSPVPPETAAKIRSLDIQGLNLSMTVADIREKVLSQGYVVFNECKGSYGNGSCQFKKIDGPDGYPYHLVTVRFAAQGAHNNAVTDISLDITPASLEYDYFHSKSKNVPLRPWTEFKMSTDAMRIIDTMCNGLGEYNASIVKIPCDYKDDSRKAQFLEVKIPQAVSADDGHLYELEVFLAGDSMYKVLARVVRMH